MATSTISGSELYLWYQKAREEAVNHNIELSELDWLVLGVAELTSLSLRLGTFSSATQIKSSRSLPELAQLWQQRLQQRLPVQYLLGQVYWRRFCLKVSPAVLIPRPETELIVELALQHHKISHYPQHWVDLGTGSGAIALGLADILPQATIHAVDISAPALEIAQANALNLGFSKQIKFYQGSWWQPLFAYRGKITGMVANPPYIPTTQIPDLQPEVADYEPHLALDGGHDGLDDIKHLIDTAPQYLVTDGLWLIELMIDQANTVVQLLEHQGAYHGIKVLTDLSGVERFVLAYKK